MLFRSMKYERMKNLILSSIAFLTFFSGIIRHDINEKEYMKLATEKQFDCVGQVCKDTSSSGSCVLISDRFVLSTTHAFIDSDTHEKDIEYFYFTVNSSYDDTKALIASGVYPLLLMPATVGILGSSHPSTTL